MPFDPDVHKRFTLRSCDWICGSFKNTDLFFSKVKKKKRKKIHRLTIYINILF